MMGALLNAHPERNSLSSPHAGDGREGQGAGDIESGSSFRPFIGKTQNGRNLDAYEQTIFDQVTKRQQKHQRSALATRPETLQERKGKEPSFKAKTQQHSSVHDEIKYIDDFHDDTDLTRSMGAQKYLYCRLIPELNIRLKRAPVYARLYTALQICVLFCQGASAYLASHGMSKYVILFLSLSALTQSFVEISMLSARLHGNNVTLAALERVQLWWHGLTLVERRQAANKDELVMQTEKILEREAMILVGHKSSRLEKPSDKLGKKGAAKQA